MLQTASNDSMRSSFLITDILEAKDQHARVGSGREQCNSSLESTDSSVDMAPSKSQRHLKDYPDLTDLLTLCAPLSGLMEHKNGLGKTQIESPLDLLKRLNLVSHLLSDNLYWKNFLRQGANHTTSPNTQLLSTSPLHDVCQPPGLQYPNDGSTILGLLEAWKHHLIDRKSAHPSEGFNDGIGSWQAGRALNRSAYSQSNDQLRVNDDTKVPSPALTRDESDCEDVGGWDQDASSSRSDRTNSALDALIHMTTSSMQRLKQQKNNPETHETADHFDIAWLSRGPRMVKRRKTRTTFTNSQLSELEQNFNRQKYLTPSDRDRIARQLGLSNTQVITWFQNRRAKLKREAEELERDLLAARQQEPHILFTPSPVSPMDLATGWNRHSSAMTGSSESWSTNRRARVMMMTPVRMDPRRNCANHLKQAESVYMTTPRKTALASDNDDMGGLFKTCVGHQTAEKFQIKTTETKPLWSPAEELEDLKG